MKKKERKKKKATWQNEKQKNNNIGIATKPVANKTFNRGIFRPKKRAIISINGDLVSSLELWKKNRGGGGLVARGHLLQARKKARDGGMKAKCPSGVERERERAWKKSSCRDGNETFNYVYLTGDDTRRSSRVFFFFFLCQGQFFRPRPSVSLECSILNYDACMCVYVCIHACRERWNLWTGSKDTLKRRWIRFQSCTDGSRFFFGAQVRGKVLWIFIFHQRGGVGIIVERVVVE